MSLRPPDLLALKRRSDLLVNPLGDEMLAEKARRSAITGGRSKRRWRR
jgi:hypothetical protein